MEAGDEVERSMDITPTHHDRTQVSNTMLHAGLLSGIGEEFRGIQSLKITTQTIYLIGASHMLNPILEQSSSAAYPYDFLSQLPYVLPRAGGSLRRLIDAMFAREGINKPNLLAEIDQIEVLGQMVQQGIACTISANAICDGKYPLTHVPLNSLFPFRSIYFIYNPELPPDLSTKMKKVGQYLKSHVDSIPKPATIHHIWNPDSDYERGL
ncbi:LysR substrate-binding domain-containing protein [Alicyclobacillus fastidiosus]|uniref:LysR substrate-binding domain-containing protein n=1 Tax=Alicyclobacillus fastidiosus TaxID=392011 RepID=UPI0023E97A66|nr:LysR substrate-binding domain-containing protein [Alicyclobacillus fastidiosus]GMA62818.1 hypothetical protein GCM10025859_32580 [Alicyclobacillus fastidiosus]